MFPRSHPQPLTPSSSNAKFFSGNPTRPSKEHSPDWHPYVFVWTVWLLMLLTALGLVWKYGGNVPVWDDWLTVPFLVGERPFTVASLFELHARVNRLPLPKLILMAVLTATGGNFQLVQFLNVLLMGASAFALVLATKRLRGHTICADAFFPITLLSLGHTVNFLWAWQIKFFLMLAVASVLIVVMVWNRRGLRPATTVLIGMCLILLSLCGPAGMAITLPLTVWLVYTGIRGSVLGEQHSTWNALLIFGLTVANLTLIGLHFFTMQRRDAEGGHVQPWDMLVTSVQLLSQNFSPIARSWWPYSGFAVVGVLLLCGVMFFVGLRHPSTNRFRALGLAAFLAASLLLALVLGWGRTGFGDGGFDPSYAILGTPAFCCVYLIAALSDIALGRFLQIILWTISLVLLIPNVEYGLTVARNLRDRRQAFEKDLRAGMPMFLLAERYSRAYSGRDLYWDEQELHNYLRMLQKAPMEPFKDMAADPDVDADSIPVVPTVVHLATWGDTRCTGNNPESSLLFEFPAPRFVVAVRLKYTYERASSREWLKAAWRKPPRKDSEPEWREDSFPVDTSAGEQTLTMWVNDSIDQLCIYPGTQPFIVRVSEIALLVPKADTSPISVARR